jgi:hypothetical protein
MRILFILAMAAIPAVAQSPIVRLINATHPASKNFQIGDRFELVIAGPPDQPVSVRTTMQGRTDGVLSPATLTPLADGRRRGSSRRPTSVRGASSGQSAASLPIPFFISSSAHHA